MRRTFVTRVEDRAGSFLKAARVIGSCGGNIARTSYNRTVDSRTMFLDVTADSKEALDRIAEGLGALGYLEGGEDDRVILIDLRLRDVPGAILPVLEVLDRHNVNISYMNARDDGGRYQTFRMGIYLEDTETMKAVLDEIASICQVEVRDYEGTERELDNTVFYITFANDMKRLLSLDDEQADEMMIASNMAMQQLDSAGESPQSTFTYIRRFAEAVAEATSGEFAPVIRTMDLPGNRRLTMFEPPCGSTTYVLESDEEQLFVDGGYSRLSDRMMDVIDATCPAGGRRRTMLLTHADIDHIGIWKHFDRILTSGTAADDIRKQRAGEPSFRESDPRHAPYYKLGTIIVAHDPPDPERVEVIGRRRWGGVYEHIGSVTACGLSFDAYEGNGGHVPGDTIFACEELNIVFTGDDLINPQGSSESQYNFNLLAPHLMRSVNMDSAKAKECRLYINENFEGWTACPGHGGWMRIENS